MGSKVFCCRCPSYTLLCAARTQSAGLIRLPQKCVRCSVCSQLALGRVHCCASSLAGLPGAAACRLGCPALATAVVVLKQPAHLWRAVDLLLRLWAPACWHLQGWDAWDWRLDCSILWHGVLAEPQGLDQGGAWGPTQPVGVCTGRAGSIRLLLFWALRLGLRPVLALLGG
jgi:hypothetical protein